MFDYKLLSALAAVVEQAGFERAAQVLGLSQSAISQRIKLLEARIGQPVLVRATPPGPTEVGRQLLNHVQQVRLLERDLQRQVPALDAEGMPERLRIALNADSLATWWAEAVSVFKLDGMQALPPVQVPAIRAPAKPAAAPRVTAKAAATPARKADKVVPQAAVAETEWEEY